MKPSLRCLPRLLEVSQALLPAHQNESCSHPVSLFMQVRFTVTSKQCQGNVRGCCTKLQGLGYLICSRLTSSASWTGSGGTASASFRVVKTHQATPQIGWNPVHLAWKPTNSGTEITLFGVFTGNTDILKI